MIQVLIVDDEIHCAEGIKCAIDWDSIKVNNVFTAYSMSQAQNIFMQEEIHIIILDIEMPKGSGFDLLHWIQENKYIPVAIILTSYATFEYAKLAINYQCLDYLLKPVSRENLLNVVKRGVVAVAERQGIGSLLKQNNKIADKHQSIENTIKDFSSLETVVRYIKTYIKNNLSEELSRGQIAEKVCMSPDYVSRVFRQKTGIQLSEYITEKRLEEARRLLETTDLSVGEVAFKVGYYNIAYFSRVFRIRCKMTPTQYRTNFIKNIDVK